MWFIVNATLMIDYADITPEYKISGLIFGSGTATVE